jgi:hypothetical protein
MFRPLSGRPCSRGAIAPPKVRPRVECLEDRTVLSTTDLMVSPNPATAGQAVTLTATVTETAGDEVSPGTSPIGEGRVTFLDGSTPLATAVSVSNTNSTQGVAKFTTSGLGVGTHFLTAQYTGESVSNPFPPPFLFSTVGSTSGAVAEVVNPLPPVDVTGSVSLTPVKPRKHQPANPLRQGEVLRNVGGTTLHGPLDLVLDGLTPTVRLKNRSGFAQGHGHAGAPYLAADVTLDPGQEVTLTLLFSDPRHRKIRFTAAVFAGAGVL